MERTEKTMSNEWLTTDYTKTMGTYGCEPTKKSPECPGQWLWQNPLQDTLVCPLETKK